MSKNRKNAIKIENLPSRTSFRRRRKVCPFSGENGLKIDYKDPKMLQRYMSEKGKIAPSRITAVSHNCLLYTSPSPRDATLSRMPSSA